MHPLTNGLATPTQLSLSSAGPTWAQGFHRACLKQVTRTSFELLGCLDQQVLQLLGQFHLFPPNRPSLEYTIFPWIVYFFCFPYGTSATAISGFASRTPTSGDSSVQRRL